MENQASSLSGEERVRLLFEFLGSYARANQSPVLNVKEREGYISFPPTGMDNEWVSYAYQDSSGNGTPILQVRKPEFSRCPQPDPLLSRWLMDGWDDYHNDVRLRCPEEVLRQYELKALTAPDPAACLELHPVESRAYERWLSVRGIWSEEQLRAEEANNLFATLFEFFTTLRRDGETLELAAASMFFRKKGDSSIDHPVFLKRAAVEFDTERNVLSVVDTEDAPYLYEDVFAGLEDIEATALKTVMKDLHDDYVHPFDRDKMPVLARQLIHGISARGRYCESAQEDGSRDIEFALLQRYGLLLMKKPTGVAQAIQRALEALDAGFEIPNHLLELVGAKCARDLPTIGGEISVDRRLAATDGEDPDILLAKTANREQLEIARVIEKTDAVLVQGPPGTGKTHTIANLLGHFLSQGKKVLVTSAKDKALEVLRDKLPAEVRSLCVAVLGDSNAERERAIDAIVDKQSSTSLEALHRSIQRLEGERESIIEELSRKRHRLFEARRDESGAVLIDGELRPTLEVAKHVGEMHAEGMDAIMPGPVLEGLPFPYSGAELAALYSANAQIEAEEEPILLALKSGGDICGLPEPSVLREMVYEAHSIVDEINAVCERFGWRLVVNEPHHAVRTQWGLLGLSDNQKIVDRVKEIQSQLSAFAFECDWMIAAAADGARGPAYAGPWCKLCELIDETDELSAVYHEKSFGHVVSLGGRTDYASVIAEARKRSESLRKGKIAAFVSGLFGGGSDARLARVTVDGGEPSTTEQLQLVEQLADLEEHRARSGVAWDQLVAANGGPNYTDLQDDNPERMARKWLRDIQMSVSWCAEARRTIEPLLDELGLPLDMLPGFDDKLDEADAIRRASDYVTTTIGGLLSVLLDLRRLDEIDEKRYEAVRSFSDSCNGCKWIDNICESLMACDCDAYDAAYAWLLGVRGKVATFDLRNELLSRIDEGAAAWAAAIRSKQPPHDASAPPDCMLEAWRYGQEMSYLNRIQCDDADGIQQAIMDLSLRYRQVTAKLAADKAWYAMIKRMQANVHLTQALQGWKLDMRRVGKGTGKYAAKWSADARRRMADCQEAVPAWIMPMSQAMSMLHPMKNHFDVLIVDEASQAGITSLPLLCLAEKIVIVGDDAQVNPADIGMKMEKRDALAEMTIAGVIPNANLYGPGCSLYDLMSTTLTRLMLKEHFRCVPDIIRFSSHLSYSDGIKPLREASSTELRPALVEYRVVDGHRSANGKRNEREALAIVDIVEACLRQPEYQDKTFGVISMLGIEQGKLVEQRLLERFDMDVVERHQIICGGAANFQGDERDVIILSLVDSNEKDGPLHLMRDGKDNEIKKRYNVAVSRAKDQLWVVHSLEPEYDLKPNDIRRRLIDHVRNPQALRLALEEADVLADSPFEREVAAALRVKGYRIQQQYEVGSYRIDIALVQDNMRIAIECDGERWHSDDEKVLEDMERQAILERLGWRFIRIRGSKYYRDKRGTLENVFSMLGDMGVVASDSMEKGGDSSLLLRRVREVIDGISEKRSAGEPGASLKDTRERQTTIESALSSKCLEDLCCKCSNDEVRQASEPVSVVGVDTRSRDVVAVEKRDLAANHYVDYPESVGTHPMDGGSRGENVPDGGCLQGLSSAGAVIRQVARELGADCISIGNKEFLVVCGLEGRQSIEDAASTIGYRCDYRAEGCAESSGSSCWSLFPSDSSDLVFARSDAGRSNRVAFDPIVSRLEAEGVEYYDRRDKLGMLWVVDAYGVDEIISAISRSVGVRFGYREEGGRVTRGRAAWYLKEKGGSSAMPGRKSVVAASGAATRNFAVPSRAKHVYSLAKPLRMEYERLELQGLPCSSPAAYAGESVRRSIASRMARIIACEAPIERDSLFNRIRESFGLKRSGIDIQNVNNSVLGEVPHKETCFNGHIFLWREEDSPDDWCAFRPNGAGIGGMGTYRSVDQIAPEEIVAAARYVLQANPSGMSKEALVATVGRQFGFQRLGRTIKETIALVLADAVAADAVDYRGDGYYLP